MHLSNKMQMNEKNPTSFFLTAKYEISSLNLIHIAKKKGNELVANHMQVGYKLV
jgi:hypothetical protein